MNIIEIWDIFDTADANNDGVISKSEWMNFYELFIDPYNKNCDPDANNLIEAESVVDCFMPLKEDNEIFFKAIDLTPNAWPDIINILSNQGSKVPDKSLTLYAYIFMRRIMLVWGDCVVRYLPKGMDLDQVDSKLLSGMQDYQFRDCATSIMMPFSTI